MCVKTIVIDPGHGGSDPGAVNGTRQEKDDTLRLGLAVRDQLEKMGQNVIMTRDSDVFIPLPERSAISNNAGADLFVSIHRNSTDLGPGPAGVENFVQVGSPPINTKYAEDVLNEIVSAGVQKNRGISTANFAVLRNTKAPAMLLEMGFITNPEDNRLFDANLDAYATAIAQGIVKAVGDDPPGDPPDAGDPRIREIQERLNDQFQLDLPVNGLYTPDTRRALTAALQNELDLYFDADLPLSGALDEATLSHIPALRVGTRGPLVALLQDILYAVGYKTEATGVYDAQTEAAVKAFQRDNGLTVDGVAGPLTFRTLLTL